MSTADELLARHLPVLKYDSQESYFADSAAIWTDNPGNRLTSADGGVIATAGQGLDLAFLGPSYPGGRKAAGTDTIGNPTREYREQARRLHTQSAYANRVYGHAVVDGAGDQWLQYWFFYFYNDYNLIGHIIRAGLHEGDWELVQIRMRDGKPAQAVYSQHAQAEARDWREVDVVPGSERPFVYVARGSHAGYFEPGTHWTGHWFDHADAKRKSPELTLEIVVDGDDRWDWIRWPGSWGDTRKREGHPLDSDSPRSPGSRRHWDDPRVLVDKVVPPRVAAVAQPTPTTPPPPPHIVPEWADGRIKVHYHVLDTAEGEQPVGLAVTINSPDEGAPPTTEAFPVDARTGAVTVAAAVDPSLQYEVHASSATRLGLASDSVRAVLAPAA